MERKVVKHESFKELKESWGSEYEITSGPNKGYRVALKVILKNLESTGETDGAGLPVFKATSQTVVTAIPKGVKRG